MANLIDFTFSKKSDRAISDSEWFVNEGQVVQALDGNDMIVGHNPSGNLGIFLYKSTLHTGAGNDTVDGAGGDLGIALYGGIVNTGDGNDLVNGKGGYAGIYTNYDDSAIETGSGNDIVLGTGGAYGILTTIRSIIDTGTGNDVVTGRGESTDSSGVYLYNSTITTGDGKDIVTDTGGAYGLEVRGGSAIETGNGNDVITGIGGYAGIGVFDAGSRISTGAGDDTVDALAGGFRGSGLTDLGSGDDNLKGFGTGFFDGGDGTDVLTFNSGTYSIQNLGSGHYLIGWVMDVTNFEAFGVGAVQTSFLAAAAAGTVTFA